MRIETRPRPGPYTSEFDWPILDDAGKHLTAASPFSVKDMVGHVWQWAGEYSYQQTRSAILRGVIAYQPQGSM